MPVAPSFSAAAFSALGVARGDDHLGAFRLGELRGCQTNAGRTADDNDFLACEQHYIFSEFS